jgi:hypothetical protein
MTALFKMYILFTKQKNENKHVTKINEMLIIIGGKIIFNTKTNCIISKLHITAEKTKNKNAKERIEIQEIVLHVC